MIQHSGCSKEIALLLRWTKAVIAVRRIPHRPWRTKGRPLLTRVKVSHLDLILERCKLSSSPVRSWLLAAFSIRIVRREGEIQTANSLVFVVRCNYVRHSQASATMSTQPYPHLQCQATAEQLDLFYFDALFVNSNRNILVDRLWPYPADTNLIFAAPLCDECRG